MIFTADEPARRRAEVESSRDLQAIRAHLRRELEPFLHRPAYVPEGKALLSRWGSLCRDCQAELAFDPFTPEVQRCTGCGRQWNTEQTRRWWICWYQLWLAERILQCALLDRLGDAPDCAARAGEVLGLIARRYAGWPNADNVLGPSRPFFSTYLESIWSLHLATAASLLEPQLGGALFGDLVERVFTPSAEIIADFDEKGSNRQAWNAAALFALGRITGNAGLAERAAHGPSGIIATLESGLLEDGLWYEGENYHWFALRGLVWGAALLRAAGDTDLWADGGAPGRKLRAAFRAPLLTALPDFTFPARRDSKFGVSLRQRRMAELWEIALARETEAGSPGTDGYASLLSHIYDPAVAEVEGAAGLISDVERNEPAGGVRRTTLGWKALAWAVPELPTAPPDAWRAGSSHLEATGLAVFRRDAGRTYVSLDYGESGGGHGHPDRLNLTWVADGVPWLLDFGTGSYVSDTLAWYRSTIAHNAPLLDNASQAPAKGVCVAYEEQPQAGWICAQLPEDGAYGSATIQRTVVVTGQYVVDVVQAGSSAGDRMLVLPWHGLGDVAADERGLTFARDGRTMRVLLAGRQPFQVQFGEGYGPPSPSGAAPDLRFAVEVANGEEITLAACLTTSPEIEEIDCVEDGFVVRFADGRVHLHGATDDGWRIELEHGDPIVLGGLREVPAEALPAARRAPGLEAMLTGSAVPVAAKDQHAAARCRRVKHDPALDGTLDGFDVGAPLALDTPEQFRRAEEPWQGPEAFAATAWLNHDDDALYLAVEVRAPAPVLRDADAPHPELDNENPDLNLDGIQVYVGTSLFYGWVVVPDPADHAAVRATAVRGTDAEADMVAGGWQETERGYRLTLRLALPDALDGFGFDLMVNRAREGRERRTGQLVWGGARGARLFLAGDRPLDGDLPWVKTE